MNPIIAMLHNYVNERWHPIIFLESPLPGPPCDDKPVRHKSKMHHTDGFATRDEALAYVHDEMKPAMEDSYGPTKLCLDKAFPWDGVGIPAMVIFFSEADADSNVKPLLGS